MNFYMQNMTTLKKKHLNVYDILKNNSYDSKDEDYELDIEDISIMRSADGYNILNITKSGENYRMNSIYSLEYETNKWLENINSHQINKVFLLMGFGNGYYVEKLLEHIKNDDIVILYEPNIEIFKFVLENFELEKILLKNNLHIFIGNNMLDDLKDFLKRLIYINNISSQSIIILPQYARLFPKELDLFCTTIRDNNQRVMMGERTNASFGKIIVNNTFSNIQFLDECNTINDYNNVFPKDVPAIIVSAGPSLAKNMEQLNKAKGKAVIFSVDRALEQLYSEDILPDYTVTIDPKKPLDFFGKGYSVEVPLFTCLESNSNILKVHKGKKIFFKASPFIDSVLYKIGKGIFYNWNTGGSVATAAFTICVQMGFKKIILVGQDLAYAEDGKTSHVGNIANVIDSYKEKWVEGINGETIRSRLDWFEYLNWFGDCIEACKDIGLEVIDATEGGAKIRGTQIMKLSEAIEKFCYKEVFVDKIEKKMKHSYVKKDLLRIEKQIDKGLLELELIKKKAITTSVLCEKMVKKCQRKTAEDKTGKLLTERIMKANEYMAHKLIFPLVDSYITQEAQLIMKDVFHLTDDKDQDMEASFTYSKKIYQLIEKATDDINKIICENFKRWSEGDQNI